MLKEVLDGGDRALVIGHTDEERVVHLADTLLTEPAARRRLAAARDALRLRLRADPEVRGRGADPRGGPGHRLHRHRWARAADRGDPRRRRAAVPARGPVPRAPAAPAEGHPALRPARLRQDAHRQGGRQLAGQEGAEVHAARTPAGRSSSTSRARSCSTSTSARPSGTSGWCSSGPGRRPARARRSSSSSTRWTRSSAPAARACRSDVENTIVPQLLSEIDGVEGLENVIVIGASNREDMIDPAILRPGRLDVKIKIERPDAEAARDIFSKYVTPTLPIHPDDLAEHGGNRDATVAGDDPARRRADVHRDRGEPLPRGHLRQRRQGGPVLQGLQLRRDDPEHRRPGQEDGDQGLPGAAARRACACSTCVSACLDEFRENEDLPNTTNPDDWARISGKKGERIVYIRTLVTGKGSRRGPCDRHDRQHRSVPVGAPRRRRTARRSGASAPAPLPWLPDLPGSAPPARWT